MGGAGVPITNTPCSTSSSRGVDPTPRPHTWFSEPVLFSPRAPARHKLTLTFIRNCGRHEGPGPCGQGGWETGCVTFQQVTLSEPQFPQLGKQDNTGYHVRTSMQCPAHGRSEQSPLSSLPPHPPGGTPEGWAQSSMSLGVTLEPWFLLLSGCAAPAPWDPQQWGWGQGRRRWGQGATDVQPHLPGTQAAVPLLCLCPKPMFHRRT